MAWKTVEEYPEVPDSITGATSKNDTRISRTAHSFVIAFPPCECLEIPDWAPSRLRAPPPPNRERIPQESGQRGRLSRSELPRRNPGTDFEPSHPAPLCPTGERLRRQRR